MLTVVVCGSVSKSLVLMRLVGTALGEAGLRAVVPLADDLAPGEVLDPAVKQAACRRHMDAILARPAAVVVANADRPGEPDYLGPNAFAEVGVAFAVRVPAYLLNGMPARYAEELTAWGVHCLHGDLTRLVNDLRQPGGHSGTGAGSGVST